MMKIWYEEDYVKPQKTHTDDAGFDLRAAENVEIPPEGFRVVSTKTYVELSRDSFGLIKPRSGLSARDGIDVFAGVVDRGYRGEIKIVLFNSKGETFRCNKGTRIAQIIPIKLADTEALMMKGKPKQETERGLKGFGSSGEI